MKFLSVLLLLGGYMLVYAAIAKSGRFATQPWEGLFQDAYSTPTPDSQPQQQSPQQPKSGRRPARPPAVGSGGVPFDQGAPFRRHP